MKLTDRDLQKMYREFNRKWFKNKLPQIQVIFTAIKECGITHFLGDRPLYMEIGLAHNICRNNAAMTLFHEMAHVAIPKYNGHGKPFQRVMKSLARRGAFEKYW